MATKPSPDRSASPECTDEVGNVIVTEMSDAPTAMQLTWAIKADSEDDALIQDAEIVCN